MATVSEPVDVDAGAVLEAMVRLPIVCPLGTLAEALRCDPEALESGLASLLDDGRLDTWETDDGSPGLVLTPLGASQLGVILSGNSGRWVPDRCWPSDDERPRWNTETDCTRGDSEGRAFDATADPDSVSGLEHLVLCEDAAGMVPDPRQNSAQGLPAKSNPYTKEWVDYGVDEHPKVPRPTILVGIGLQWSPEVEGASPCPACTGLVLGSLAYCLCCCRSGVDHLLGLDRAEAEADPELPVESDEPGFVVVTRGGSTVKVPERFARLLKGGKSVAVGPAVLGHKRR